jgi:hypothetical protein
MMNFSHWRQIQERPFDLLFVAAIVLSLLVAFGALSGGLERRDALLTQGAARKIDEARIHKQISEGELSAHKAMFYKKVPE